MAQFHSFDSTVELLWRTLHGMEHDKFKIALTNVCPLPKNRYLKDIKEIDYTNLLSRDLVTSVKRTKRGVHLVAKDVVIPATGITASFRWVVLYNNSMPKNPLLGWYDFLSTVRMKAGETFNMPFEKHKVLSFDFVL